MVLKYQRLASKATFTGPYIKKALNPDPTKSLYENGLTTGTRIDGQVISLKAVEKWCGELTMQQFREALREGKSFTLCASTSVAMMARCGLSLARLRATPRVSVCLTQASARSFVAVATATTTYLSTMKTSSVTTLTNQ